MSGVTVRLEGGEELLEKLRAMDVRVRAAVKRATLAGAQPVVDLANSLAPGPYIAAEVVSSSADGTEVAIGPDSAHWYYRFFETGAAPHEIAGAGLLAFQGDAGLVVTPSVSHPGMAARPFLRPAHDATLDEQAAAMGASLRAEIEP